MFNIFKKFVLPLLLLLTFTVKLSANPVPGVNKFAWKASLEAVKFLPLISADPFSGVIITDWYSINQNVRYKVDIYVLSGILNSRSVQVSIFKQIKDNNIWKDVQVSSEVANYLEENILNQAKKIRSVYYE